MTQGNASDHWISDSLGTVTTLQYRVASIHVTRAHKSLTQMALVLCHTVNHPVHFGDQLLLGCQDQVHLRLKELVVCRG